MYQVGICLKSDLSLLLKYKAHFLKTCKISIWRGGNEQVDRADLVENAKTHCS